MLNYQRVNLPYIEHLGILLWASGKILGSRRRCFDSFETMAEYSHSLAGEEARNAWDQQITGMIGDGNSAEIFLTFFNLW